MIFPVHFANIPAQPRFSGKSGIPRQPNDKPEKPLTDAEISTFNMLVEGLETPRDLKGAMVFPDIKALEAKYAAGREAFVDELIRTLGNPQIITQRDLFEHGLWVRSQIRISSKGDGDSLRGYKLYVSPFIEDKVRERVPFLRPTHFMQQVLSPHTSVHVDVEEDPEQWFRLERRFIDYYI